MLAIIISLFILLIVFVILSGTEVAFHAANKLKIEFSNQKGEYVGKISSDFIKNPTKYNNTIVLGKTIVMVIFTVLFYFTLTPFLKNWGVPDVVSILIQLLISTLILLLFGEFIPNAIFKIYADKLLPFVIFPFRIIYWLLKPFVFILNTILKIFGTIFNFQLNEEKLSFTNNSIDNFIKEHELDDDNDDDDEIDNELFENVLDFKHLKVRDCMVPRREISAIDKDATINELKHLIIKTNHSRILVYDDNIDKILGYVHHFDLHKKPTSIEEIIIPIKVVPETMHIQKLLNELIKHQKSIAWVVDEYGGTSGVITLEDILEEIFGEIDDEYDKDQFIENQLSENEYILSGRLEIDYLNKEYKLDLPEGDYETLSGFIIAHHETIPEKNELIEIEHYTFKILNVSETKIETVKLEIK